MRNVLLVATVLLTATSARGEIAWRPDLKTAHDEAAETGKLILVHFYSDNCVWCDRLEQGVFRDPEVAASIESQFVPVKINGQRDTRLSRAFGVSRYPTDVIVATDGDVIAHQISPQDSSRYLAMLSRPAVSERIGNPENSAIAAASAPHTPTPHTPTPYTPAPHTPAPLPATAVNGAGAFVRPPIVTPNPLVAGPGPELTDFAMPPGIAAGHFDMSAFQGTPVIPVSQRGTATPQRAGLVGPTNSAAPRPRATQELPPEAMDGYCPVTVITEERWVQGNPEFGVIHLGQLYLFASAEAQSEFQASPERYTPVLNGIDVVKFFDKREIVPGVREWGLTDPVTDRMFFFADEASMNHFYDHHARYVTPAIELMKRAAADANMPR